MEEEAAAGPARTHSRRGPESALYLLADNSSGRVLRIIPALRLSSSKRPQEWRSGVPHTADVVAFLETSRFHVADAGALLAQNSVALLYVAAVLARCLYDTDQAFVGLKKVSGWNLLVI